MGQTSSVGRQCSGCAPDIPANPTDTARPAAASSVLVSVHQWCGNISAKKPSPEVRQLVPEVKPSGLSESPDGCCGAAGAGAHQHHKGRAAGSSGNLSTTSCLVAKGDGGGSAFQLQKAETGQIVPKMDRGSLRFHQKKRFEP